ncbi:MAG: DUF1552 domain-containing protein, partial [Polyangiaceae bacterium]|nr:DUF1552 domain-containing protein [Polyangiaceae bacterium]
MQRRIFLQGLGSVSLGLPLLESIGRQGSFQRGIRAAEIEPEPFAFFFRQANGVAAAQQTEELGAEPELFWPRNTGPLTQASTEGRALGELERYFSKMLVLGNVNMEYFDYDDGHANGALQCLTAQGPYIPGVGGDSEANGQSVD